MCVCVWMCTQACSCAYVVGKLTAFSAALFAGNEQLLYVTDSEFLNSTQM